MIVIECSILFLIYNVDIRIVKNTVRQIDERIVVCSRVLDDIRDGIRKYLRELFAVDIE